MGFEQICKQDKDQQEKHVRQRKNKYRHRTRVELGVYKENKCHPNRVRVRPEEKWGANVSSLEV